MSQLGTESLSLEAVLPIVDDIAALQTGPNAPVGLFSALQYRFSPGSL